VVGRGLIGEHVELPGTRVASGGQPGREADPRSIAGMMCRADCINDVNVLRGRWHAPGVRRGGRTTARAIDPRKPMSHLLAHRPWQTGWKALWNNITGHSPAIPRAERPPRPRPTRQPRPDPGDTWKVDPGRRITHVRTVANRPNRKEISPATPLITDPRIQAKVWDSTALPSRKVWASAWGADAFDGLNGSTALRSVCEQRNNRE